MEAEEAPGRRRSGSAAAIDNQQQKATRSKSCGGGSAALLATTIRPMAAELIVRPGARPRARGKSMIPGPQRGPIGL